MPPTQPQQATVSVTPNHSPLISILITIVVIVLALGVAWYSNLISFASSGQPVVSAPTSSAASAQETSSETFLTSGTYALVGRGAGQTVNYSGTLAIKWRENTPNIFDLQWNVTTGQVQYGVGILTNNILSVSYYEMPDGVLTDVGVGSYKLIDSTHLKGEWTSVRGGTSGTEEFILQPTI